MNPEEDDPKGLLQRLLSGWNKARENLAADVALGLTPAGVVADVQDAATAIRERDPVGLGLAAAGFVPFGGDIVKGVGKGLRRAASDLPMDEASRLARAREMGFDVDRPMYHGSPDWRKVDESGGFEARRKPVYFTSKENIAQGYADTPVLERNFYRNPNWKELQGVRSFYVNPGRTLSVPTSGSYWQGIPSDLVRESLQENEVKYLDKYMENLGKGFRGHWLYGRGDRLDTEMLADIAKELGYDSMELSEILDTKNSFIPLDKSGLLSTVRAVFDPARIRYTDAAFDPAQRGSANLLAGTSAAMIGGSALARALNDERNREY